MFIFRQQSNKLNEFIMDGAKDTISSIGEATRNLLTFAYFLHVYPQKRTVSSRSDGWRSTIAFHPALLGAKDGKGYVADGQ